MTTHKQRFLAAVNLEQPDRVPIDTSFMDLIHVERITGKKAFGAGGGGGGGAWAISPEVKTDLNKVMVENQRITIEAIRRIDLDAFAVSDYWFFPKGYRHKFIDKDTYVDMWGEGLQGPQRRKNHLLDRRSHKDRGRPRQLHPSRP
jgi:hypothetical protein